MTAMINLNHILLALLFFFYIAQGSADFLTSCMLKVLQLLLQYIF